MQDTIWEASFLTDYTSNSYADYYAIPVGSDIVVPPGMTMDGGNLLFTSDDGLPSVSLEFSGGNSPALRNQRTLVFDTLSRLSFADYSAGAIRSAGNLIIQNVNDGVKNPETPDVFFSGNSASSSLLGSYGCAIYSTGDVSISGNGDVSFSGNSTTTTTIDPVPAESYGGAIRGGSVSIIGNGDVNFSGNSTAATATIDSTPAESYGGAIYATRGVSIIGNGDVNFSGNSTAATTIDSSPAESYGGAIYATGGDLCIMGNETVRFEKNYEVEGSTYHLRSIYASGWMKLSAKTGGNITFYDSVYAGRTLLNADYTDANGETQQAKGDIIFSGLHTKTHLDAILEANNEGRMATDAEILNSRTSTLGYTMLYGGSLQVVDGAILSISGLSVAAGSSASVLLRDARLNVDAGVNVNGTLSFGTGSSFELQGANTTTGSLTLGDEVSLSVTLDNSHLETAALTLTGSVSTGTLSLNLNVAEERAVGMYRILSAGNLATEASWTAENVSVQGSGAAAGAAFGDLVWQDGVLYYAASPVWSNHSGSMVWSSTDTNWNNGSTFRAGQDVIFMDRGAGEVQLVGELAPASIYVQNTEGNDYAFTGSGKLSGNTSLTKTGAGELTIATANDYTGRTELQEGTLNVHHSTALGATATGEASLTAAAGTTLKVANSSHLVLAGSSNSLAGAVEVADGATLEMKGSGYAATSSTVNGSLVFTDTTASMGTTTVNGTLAFSGTSAATGTLSGSGTVQVTDSQVGVESISSFTGNLKVEGKGSGLSIGEGSYKGSGTLQVSGGTLTFGGATAGISLDAGGQLVLQSWDDAVASVTANSITVRDGATLSALGEMPEISAHELSVDLNCTRLTLYAGATLETENVRFDLNNGMLTLAVTSSSTEKIELVLAENAVYTGSEQIVLFTNVGKTIFAYGAVDTSNGMSTVSAADYFTGKGISSTTQLVYDSTTGVVYLEGVATVPEPTTATLSLLALAGFCARRRRK